MPRNYDEVVKVLIKEAGTEGYIAYKVNDSEEDLIVHEGVTNEEIVEHATAADEATIYFKNEVGDKFGVYLVYGNTLEETICDYSAKADADRICTRVAAHFEDR